MKSEVNGDNFQEVCKKSREVKIRDGKGRPWERKAKIGEIVPSKSLVGIMGLVYLRCSSGRAGRNQSQLGLWDRGVEGAAFVWVSGLDLGLEAG